MAGASRGAVCKRGHGGKNNRYKASNSCVECTRLSGQVLKETQNKMFVVGPRIPPLKNPVKGNRWPFPDRFKDDPRAARREPYWRDSMAYRRNVRAA